TEIWFGWSCSLWADYLQEMKAVLLVRSLNSRRRREGIIIPLAAVSLVVILAIAAIALDGGMLLSERRHAQAVADAAALAAAIDLQKNYSTNQGLDPSGTAKTSALTVAANNGYANDVTNSVVKIGRAHV